MNMRKLLRLEIAHSKVGEAHVTKANTMMKKINKKASARATLTIKTNTLLMKLTTISRKNGGYEGTDTST